MIPEAPQTSDPQAKLLLIEPEQTSAAFMRHMLMSAGYEVIFAPGGKEGLIAAWRDQPDAVLLELDLPDIDGLEVIRRLRADPRTQKTWILCLTGRSSPQAADQAYELGIEDYIVKQKDAIDLVLRRLAGLRERRALAPGGRTMPLRPGQIVAFLGAKGGIGTSSLCLNLANEIAGLHPQRQMVAADLVLPMGDLVALCGSKRPVDVVQLTSKPARALTPDSLRMELPRPGGWLFQLVPGSNDPAQGAELVPDRLAPLIQTLRLTYGIVFVDLGRNLSPLAMLVLHQADVLVTVFSPVESVVYLTREVLSYLRGEGIPDERFYLLSNRPLGMEDLASDVAARILGRAADASVSHLGQNMYLSNVQGVPLTSTFAGHSSTRSLERAADDLAQRVHRIG